MHMYIKFSFLAFKTFKTETETMSCLRQVGFLQARKINKFAGGILQADTAKVKTNCQNRAYFLHILYFLSLYTGLIRNGGRIRLALEMFLTLKYDFFPKNDILILAVLSLKA